MKKKVIIGFFIIIFILFTIYISFYRKEKINYQLHTIIEDNKSYVISVIIPKTNISKLDQKIENCIYNEINTFKKNNNQIPYLLERNELNIDFDFYKFNDRYINITLKQDIYDGNKKTNQYSIYTYLFDLKQNNFINILDLFEDKDMLFLSIKDNFLTNKKINISNMEDVFMSISNNNLIIYTITDNLHSISIPLTEIGFKLPITNDILSTENTTTEKTSNIIDPIKPVVAITFDDGPSKYTEEIIEVLKENDCNATFFVLGNKVEAYQDVIRKSIKNGNEIGNHSYNHKWLSRLSTNEIINQIDKTQNILKETVGYTPIYLRPTYGSVNQRIRKNTNLEIVLWTIDTKDWKIKNVDRIVERATKNISDGDIILMHDIFERSSEALKKLIPLLKEKGYQLVTISELEEVKLLRTKF